MVLVCPGLKPWAISSDSAAAACPENILLVGLDTGTDSFGNPLPVPGWCWRAPGRARAGWRPPRAAAPKAILDQLHAGDGSEGGYNTNTLIIGDGVVQTDGDPTECGGLGCPGEVRGPPRRCRPVGSPAGPYRDAPPHPSATL